MIDYAERYRTAATFDEMLAHAAEKVELWTPQRRVARVPVVAAEEFSGDPKPGKPDARGA